MNTFPPTAIRPRLGFLFAAAILGIFISWITYYFFYTFVLDRNGNEIIIRILPLVIILILSLPVTILLWCYRTFDVVRQYHQTLFFEASRALQDTTFKEKIAALQQLKYVRDSNIAELRELADSTTNNLNLYISDDFATKIIGADLSGMNFTNANFRNTNIGDTDLSKSIFQKATLSGICWYNVNLDGADMKTTKGMPVTSKCTVLDQCSFVETDMSHSNYSRASFIDSTFGCATILQTNFEETDFSGVKMSRMRFKQNHNLDENISETSFKGAIFSGAVLMNVDFSGINLSDADFIGSELSPETINFSMAIINNTKLPYDSIYDALKDHPSLEDAEGSAIYLGEMG